MISTYHVYNSRVINLLYSSNIVILTYLLYCIAQLTLGIAYCGMIGHIARRNYAIIGPPVDKSMKIMDISCDKVNLTKIFYVNNFI